jgi:hypothetical protein
VVGKRKENKDKDKNRNVDMDMDMHVIDMKDGDMMIIKETNHKRRQCVMGKGKKKAGFFVYLCVLCPLCSMTNTILSSPVRISRYPGIQQYPDGEKLSHMTFCDRSP